MVEPGWMPHDTDARRSPCVRAGIPLLGVYRGLGLNFLRPRFIRKLREFDADVVMFVDPIWLCAQCVCRAIASLDS